MFVGAVLEGAYSFPGGLRGRERPQVPHLSARFHGAPLSTRHTTEHPTAHKARPPDAPAARRTAGWGCGRIPKRAAHLVDCKAASWGAGAERFLLKVCASL